MSNEKMREEFEAWAEQMGWNIEKRRSLEGESYVYPSAMDAWMAWQASRAAVVIDLSSANKVTALPDRLWILGGAVVSAIEAAGVKVKP
ncbi:hypothetical protein [Pseudomonas syringae]|uniref:hypothetical protein n=1 Tax=Pseudomonas syringae TaxID=317 RepID=UPI0012AEBE7F|nr:hypothetical protein [Pseudomonas syringae]